MSCRQDEELAELDAQVYTGQRRAAREAGRAAYADGQPFESCPHDVDSLLGSEWRNGFAVARGEGERRVEDYEDIEF